MDVKCDNRESLLLNWKQYEISPEYHIEYYYDFHRIVNIFAEFERSKINIRIKDEETVQYL